MSNWGVTASIIVLLSSVSHAQDAADIQAFNDTFVAYKEAMQQPRSDLRMDAARDALAAGRKIFELADARLPILMANYGGALFAGAHQEESKKILKEALALAEDIHGDDSIKLVAILSILADAESELYSPGRQLKHYKRALKIVAGTAGKESEEYAILAFRVSKNLIEYSKSAIGRKYLLEAYEIFLAKKGETAMETGLAAFYLGRTEFSKGNHKKSIQHILTALKAFEAQKDDPSHQLYARAMLVRAYEERGQSDLATEHCIAIGQLSKLRPNQDYQPLFRMAPSYPSQLLRQGIEGHVDFSFTIDENGFVRDPQIIDRVSSGRLRRDAMSELRTRKEDRSFDAAALKALERFRYAPRFADGNAVKADGVKTRISFKIAD